MKLVGPLKGKRIMVTRAAQQAGRITRLLEDLDATVLLLPAVSFSLPPDLSGLDAAIAELESFDWVLFTSANAVRFFAGRCRECGCNWDSPKFPKCAAVGPVTAGVAAEEGFLIDYVAIEFLGAALARELSETLRGRRVLLPRSNRAGKELPESLAGAGAQVTAVVAYHTGSIGETEPGVIEALRNGQVDAITFFSPSAVENLRSELGTELLARLESRTAYAAVGPVTAAALRRAGLTVAIEPSDATAESMAAAIKNYYSPKAAHGSRTE